MVALTKTILAGIVRGMKAIPLSKSARKSLIKRALKLPDNKGFSTRFLKSLDDVTLRRFAGDLPPDEKIERMMDVSSEDWTEYYKGLSSN